MSFYSEPAFAQKRIALLIGNSTYTKGGPLRNPVSDSTAMAAMLRGAGFDTVELKNNLKIVQMRRVLRDFSRKVRNADIAIVYFAGHGIEVNGINYVIPVDAELEQATDVEDETISVNRIMDLIQPAKRLRLVILDACRVNPFSDTMTSTVALRGPGRGLAKVEPPTTDTLVAFAAKAGTFAEDGDGENSPYNAALVKHLATPGLDIRIALGLVRDAVLNSTEKRQEPFIYGSLGGNLVPLVPGPAVEKPPADPDPAPAASRDYQFAERVGTKEAWESFLVVYPDGYYANLARAQLKKLAAEEARAAAAEVERQARAEQARLAKEGAKAEEQAKAAAQAKAAEQARIAAEKKAIDEAKAAARATATPPPTENAAGSPDRAAPVTQKSRVREKELRTVRRPPTASTDTPQSTATRPATRPSTGYASQGSGAISNGNCNCKNICDGFAARGQLSGPTLRQCKSDCEQKFSGCNVGATR